MSGTDPLGLNAALLVAGLATMSTGAETGSGIGSVGGPPGAVVGAVVGAVSVGGVLLYNNREAVGDALDKGMTSLGEAEILKAESEMAFWNDPCGAFASVFGGDDSGNPNVGKDLTDEEKNELGGIGSGAPGGPEDEDEWNKVQSTGSSEGEIKNTYGSIKDAPNIQKDLDLVKTVQ